MVEGTTNRIPACRKVTQGRGIEGNMTIGLQMNDIQMLIATQLGFVSDAYNNLL